MPSLTRTIVDDDNNLIEVTLDDPNLWSIPKEELREMIRKGEIDMVEEKKSEDGKEEEPREEIKILVSQMKPMLTEIKPNTTHIFSVPENDISNFQMAFETLKMDLMMPTVYEELNINLVAVRVEKKDKSEDVVEAIIKDFTDRRGLRQEWEQIDEDIQEEIKERWIGLARDVLRK